jgi:archaellum component FlaG (FlaF/FlaG flagellin family)
MKNIIKVFLTAFVLCLTTCDTPTNENSETANTGNLFAYAGTASSLEIANDSRGYTFPDTFLNESNEVSITLKNTGDGIIKLTGKPYIILDGATALFSVSVQPEASTISPGASVSFKIKFTPLNATESYVYVSIPNNSKNLPDFSFTVYGKGIPPKPIAAILYNGNEIPQNGPINAGEVILTQPKNITVIIKNDGRLVLTIDTANITIIGTEKESFIIKDPPAQNISPGNESQLIIECNPDKLGGNNATLRIPTNDGSRLQVEVYLQAQAVKGSAVLELSQGTTVITNNSLTPFDFGPVDLGTDKTLVFTIKNTGNISLELTGDPAVESSNALFSISTQPAKKTLLPGIPEDTTFFIVKYTPTVEMEETAKITIMNSSDAMLFTLNVKGTGYVKRPQITMKQGNSAINQYEEFDFGRVPLNEPKDVSFTIWNSGDAYLNFVTVNDNRINLGENNSGFFSVIQQPSASTAVAPNAATTFSIRFNPTIAGNGYTANVQIKTNSRANDEFSFIVKANSYEKKPQITVIVGSAVAGINQNGECDFGSVYKGQSKAITCTIKNSGDADLIFETVGGNKVNLSDNAESYFSITQQPSVTTLLPGNTLGSSTTFIINFSPAIVGSNFTAVVKIKTNSQNFDEFLYTVKGSGRDYYMVGDTGPAGGKIFYDAGAVINGWRYLEAAPTDFTSVQWGAYNTDIAGTQLSIGSGKNNTQLIVTQLNKLGETGRAAQLCANLNTGGFNDWFLPSRDELNLMYTNLKTKGLGNFSNSFYWSSSQKETFWYDSCVKRFSNGSDGVLGDGNRDNIYSVRAIRAF